ncbi:hypothetical protein O6P43_015818 [Quillaja saponaria]|uniref:Uncharacterized protein n=1 Tax=Quillaja saponaria TaxID=32244 RepID=A0AAD7LXV4_QUISA|nr:hypothetical protein O6P43_015818 [Quillaja saponaria]
MTIQNPFRSLVLLTLLAFCVEGHNAQGSDSASKVLRSTQKLGLVAEDAITLATIEVANAKGLINAIPQLKTLKGELPDNGVLHCVGGLNDGLIDVLNLLKGFGQLDSPSLVKDSNSLLDLVEDLASFNGLCHIALRDLEVTIKLLLSRRLQDIVLLTNDVVYRVNRFAQNQDGYAYYQAATKT